jgi:hypothetical protein
MIRHAVMFRFKPGTTSADIAAITEALGGLPHAIPEIARYQFGADIGINDGNFDFVIVADFADTDDYLTYRDHPLHRAMIAERIAPHVEERAAVQCDVAS